MGLWKKQENSQIICACLQGRHRDEDENKDKEQRRHPDVGNSLGSDVNQPIPCWKRWYDGSGKEERTAL